MECPTWQQQNLFCNSLLCKDLCISPLFSRGYDLARLGLGGPVPGSQGPGVLDLACPDSLEVVDLDSLDCLDLASPDCLEVLDLDCLGSGLRAPEDSPYIEGVEQSVCRRMSDICG